MKHFKITGTNSSSNIYVGDLLAKLSEYITADKVMMVVDAKVAELYAAKLPDYPMIEISAGEENKTLGAVEALYEKFLAAELDRSVLVIGVGGGTICDIVAFAASTYLRGLSCALVPTTLLAQVDAGIGGKNGVNFKSYKNLVGVIRQPELIFCDPIFLKTLLEDDVRSGYGELIKHAIIGDKKLFSYLENNIDKALALEEAILEDLLFNAMQVKAQIVDRDETEIGERMKLNFGHTLGHAIESTEGMAHGLAVSIGMCFAAKLSVKKGLLAEEEEKRIVALLESYKLPTKVIGQKERLIDAIRKDKKRREDCINMALLKSIGEATIVEVSLNELEEFLFT